MLAKTILGFAFVAFSSFAAAAAPPACLLGAVNEYKDPSDLQAVCKSSDATSKIQQYCSDDLKSALSAFADICNEQGVKVSTDNIASATGSARASGTGSASSKNGTTLATATGTPVPTAGSGAGSGSPTATDSGNLPASTGAAGKLEIAGAALLAGLMVVAL